MKRHPTTFCSLADAGVVIVGAFVLAALAGIEPFFEKAVLVLTFALPVAAVIAWRGAADARRLINGQGTWRRPVMEGFFGGFALFPMSVLLEAVEEASAAGGHWPGLGAPFEVWVQFTWMTLLISSVLGLVGAAGALMLTAMNRAVVKACAS